MKNIKSQSPYFSVLVAKWWIVGGVCSGCWTCDFWSRVQFPYMTLPGYFWDRWPYFAGKLSWNVTTNQVISALHPSGVAKSGARLGWNNGADLDCRWWSLPLSVSGQLTELRRIRMVSVDWAWLGCCIAQVVSVTRMQANRSRGFKCAWRQKLEVMAFELVIY